MPRLLAVGYRGDGQLGEIEVPDGSQCFSEPVEVLGAPNNIDNIGCGAKHTLFLTTCGSLYTVGSNEYGQLGRNPYQEESYDIAQIELPGNPAIIQIAVGQFHNAAVADDGRLFMWGANYSSQCGSKPCQKIQKPTRVKEVSNVVQVDCGENSTIILTESCNVFVFGLIDDQPTLPMEISRLSSFPIVQVSAGGFHFSVLTSSGKVICWGQNTNGQITGNVNQKYTNEPVLVDAISKAVYIGSGAKHTIALTREGRVFSFGCNTQGQLGLDVNKRDIESAPKAVFDLLGKMVTSFSCGSRYTLIVANGLVYSFGLNNVGQLGVGTFQNTPTPIKVKNLSGVIGAFAGSEHSYFLVDDIGDLPTKPIVADEILKGPRFLSFNMIRQLSSTENSKLQLMEAIESVFSSAGCINGSFLCEGDSRYQIGNEGIGLNYDDAMYTLNLLSESPFGEQLVDLIMDSLDKSELLGSDFALNLKKCFDPELLRVFFILIWLPPLVQKTRHFNPFVLRYVKLLTNVIESTDSLFESLWNTLKTRHFNRFAQSLMMVLNDQFLTFYSNPDELRSLLSVVNRMAVANRLNEKIPYDHFYLDILEDYVNVRYDYLRYYLYKNPDLTADNVDVPKGPNPFFWFKYPCIMNVVAKSNILETHSKVQQHSAMQKSLQEDMILLFLGHEFDLHLKFSIHRNNIVHDTITELMSVSNHDIAKPLKIHFYGEEGEDEGGIKKEYFMLLFKEILQPTYGMFVEDEESHFIWFSGFPVEDMSFQMIGMLCGMAIYNSTLVQLPFPLALYKYLLGVEFTLEDLQELHPSAGNSMEHLLNYDGDDVEEVFQLTFEIDITIFGHTETVELKAGGSKIPVTNENRQEFVSLYIKRILELGYENHLQKQLQHFMLGFCKVLDASLLSLFQPRELMELMAGNENYNWEELRDNCKYKDYFHKDHPAVKAFWTSFFELSEEEKKKFLLFLMGTSRIPWKGMSKVEMIIQPCDREKLPVAHTCFNLLDLPNLEDKQEMLRRLRICIDNNEGFTLV